MVYARARKAVRTGELITQLGDSEGGVGRSYTTSSVGSVEIFLRDDLPCIRRRDGSVIPTIKDCGERTRCSVPNEPRTELRRTFSFSRNPTIEPILLPEDDLTQSEPFSFLSAWSVALCAQYVVEFERLINRVCKDWRESEELRHVLLQSCR